ncbi:magnesium protoporphyrin IX methyltransferase [Aestuariibius sp. 2305UL40-4]|uniref:magnesium protoporphyrin IX methyltransferase n=1 Tax=Aestuariibius violaceus TaxID=3234132 RepID=UPI00345E6899
MTAPLPHIRPSGGYGETRARVEDYFDRTATAVWERLTSDAPVSRVRATVRAGRERMQGILLSALGEDLAGKRVLDAGCGTGTLAIALAERGAEVVAVDLSASLVEIAERRCPDPLRERITFAAGDLRDVGHGDFDAVIAMDSLIYYGAEDLARIVGDLATRTAERVVFTAPPKTMALMAMWRMGKLFPRSDRAPVMVPQSHGRLSAALTAERLPNLREIERVSSGFYISTAYEVRP